MPQAVPAIIVAAGQAIAAEAITWAIVSQFVINVGLSGLEFRDESGERWVALTKQQEGPR